MTGKERHHDHRNHDGDQERLAQLYREQGDIEPGPGIDQRVLARAHDEVRPSSLPRPAHWLGGAAVAASLFVVVSIVINIEPPEAELPVSEPARTNAEAGAGELQAPEPRAPVSRAPQARDRRPEASEPAASHEEAAESADPADFASGLSGDAQLRAEPEALQERAASSDSAPLPDTDTMLQRRTRWAAGDEAEQAARKQYESLGALRQSEAEQDEARSPSGRADETEFEALGAETAEAQRALWLIDRLIFMGNLKRARAELEAFRAKYPDQEVPQALVDRLHEIEDEG